MLRGRIGAGNLIRLMFGLSYEWAVVCVGAVMLAYVLFGGWKWFPLFSHMFKMGGCRRYVTSS